MKVQGRPMRTVWLEPDGRSVGIIDQTQLPHRFATKTLARMADAARAIAAMEVRGAPLIGATAAYGLAMAMAADSSDRALDEAARALLATRPTAVNLHWAIDDMRRVLQPAPPVAREAAAYARARAIADEDVAINRAIAGHGLPLIAAANARKGGTGRVEILTHCNAGWLATVDWGTALAPIYLAHDRGIPVHVWVDETRPRNQGASLTAWELGEHGVPHTVIVDNAGGHLMQRGLVDLCLVGTDRTTAAGDVANKIGTYLKALAARDNDVPFYVALPSPTIDWSIMDGAAIPIEERDESEVTEIAGALADGSIARVRLAPRTSRAANPGFDVTPARLVTALVTERGLCAASREGLLAIFPERRQPLAGE
jgi:methylthioribose-1-phosphate isomerase